MTGLLHHTRHNTEATSIAMRFWARSMGDRGPSHVREDYRSLTGGLGFRAHPCWLYSVQDTVLASGPAGTCPIIAGTDWTFSRPVLAGDEVFTVARLESEERKTGRFAGDCLHQRVSVQYLDAHGKELATATSTLVHVAPEAARRAGKFADWKRWRYTHEQLAQIEQGYDAEQVRGDNPRHWEEVAVQDVLPPIVRGPLSSEEVVLFVGATRPIPGMAAFTREMAAGLTTGFIHPRNGAYESYAAGMVDDESARALGFPAAHDYGIDRIGQIASLVCNWAGDAGRLVALNARLTAPNMLGDTTWFSGRVTAVRAGEGRTGLVDIEATGTNQRGEVTVHGTVTVALPLRAPLTRPAPLNAVAVL